MILSNFFLHRFSTQIIWTGLALKIFATRCSLLYISSAKNLPGTNATCFNCQYKWNQAKTKNSSRSGLHFFQTRCTAIALQKSHSAPTNSNPTAVSVGEEILALVPSWTNCLFRWSLVLRIRAQWWVLILSVHWEKGLFCISQSRNETQMWPVRGPVMVSQLVFEPCPKVPGHSLSTRPA